MMRASTVQRFSVAQLTRWSLWAENMYLYRVSRDWNKNILTTRRFRCSQTDGSPGSTSGDGPRSPEPNSPTPRPPHPPRRRKTGKRGMKLGHPAPVLSHVFFPVWDGWMDRKTNVYNQLVLSPLHFCAFLNVLACNQYTHNSTNALTGNRNIIKHWWFG